MNVNSVLEHRAVIQIGIVVKDIKEALKHYSEFFGVENPGYVIADEYAQSNTNYRGKPTKARCKKAFFNFGECEIELLEPDSYDSAWKEGLDKGGEGLHHISFAVKDLRKKVELFQKQGIGEIQNGFYPGGQYSYLDTSEKLSLVVELLEDFDEK